MLKTLGISLRLKNTYTVNKIIYALRNTPLIKRIIHDDVYGMGWVKTLVTWISIAKEILSAFLWKFVYGAVMIAWPLILTEKGVNWPHALHIFFFLTIIGGVMNNRFYDLSLNMYYGIVSLRMDARGYVLANFFYFLLRSFLGFMAVGAVAVGITGESPIWILLIPLYVVSWKLITAFLGTVRFKRKSREKEYKESYLKMGAVILLAPAYLPLLFDYILPEKAILAAVIVSLAFGVFSFIKIIGFDSYTPMVRDGLARFMTQLGMASNVFVQNTRKTIEMGEDSTSDKTGFAYLNDLFVKRHRKILWRASLRITIIASIVLGILFLSLFFIPEETKNSIYDEVLNRIITMVPFIMYFLNRGTGFTQALFMNCDHSLLTYPFYKEPGAILKLFRIRLVEIAKVNMLPALVIGVGGSLVVGFMGGFRDPVYLLVLLISVPASSIFFSVHYLTLYYLLQPYNAASEVKSGAYTFATGLTYFVCYMLSRIGEVPGPLFGFAVIAFCLLYSVIACILVYNLAPKTFRIRS